MAAHVDDPRSIARNEERLHAAVRLTPEARVAIATVQALELSACNYTARIAYARIATDHVVRFTEALPRSTPVFWVTLIRDRYTVPFDKAGDVNLFALQQWARAELQGASFVGMVEAALYTNAGEVRPGWRRAISWHTHLLVWGISEQRIRAICNCLSMRVRTLIPGVKAAHYRTLVPEEVEGQVLYMLKAPVNEYRIIPNKQKFVDSRTGRTKRVLNGRFKSKKYQLGPGELTRMANLLADRTLDRLAFAAGQGKTLLVAINFEARAADRVAKALQRNREASKRGQPLRYVRRR